MLFSDRKVANDLGIVCNFAIVYRQGISHTTLKPYVKSGFFSNIIRYRTICYNHIVLSSYFYNISVVFLDLSNFM